MTWDGDNTSPGAINARDFSHIRPMPKQLGIPPRKTKEQVKRIQQIRAWSKPK